MKETNKKEVPPKRALSIAGAESGGTAGIQADLKTFQEIGVYGMTVITAIVGRHPVTQKNVHPMTLEAIEAQFHTAMTRVGADGMKTGMLFSIEVIELIARLLSEYRVKNLVVDPVMVGKLDSKLLKDDAIKALQDLILPKAHIITPNLFEASILLDNRPIDTVEAMTTAAKDLFEQCSHHVLVKGGRLKGPAVDVLYDGKEVVYLEAPRIPTQNTSGAGCSYSAAIAAYLAQGKALKEAVIKAKQFVTTAIVHSFTYTDNPGPINHMVAGKGKHDMAIKVYETE